MLRIMTIAGLLVLAAPTVRADVRPSLKPTVTVTNDLVRIADLVEQAGELADVAIFRAPDLGTTGSVPVARVREALRPYGLDDVDAAGLTEVVVTRPSRAITVKEIESRILQALAQRGLGTVDNLKLNIDQSLRTIHVEAGATAELQVVHLTVDPYGSRFGVVLDIPGSAILRRTPLRLSGRVTETAEATVLTRSLQRGAIIRPSDFAIERRPRVEVSKDDISQPASLVGLAARRPMRAGHVLRHADVMKPELVKRNDTVTLMYEYPGILLTVRGQATESGAEGDLVAVRNLQSKRTVHGTVTGTGQVTVTGTIGLPHGAKTASLKPTPHRPE